MPDTAAIELSLKKSQPLQNFYVLQCWSGAILVMPLKLFDKNENLQYLSSVFKHQENDKFMHKDLISVI